MSRRLQIVLDETEYREIPKLARAEKLTVAEWVRRAPRIARRPKSTGDSDRKPAAIRTAAAHTFPTADMARMLAQIERLKA